MSGEPEVAYFKLLFVADQQVLGLDVAVDAVEGVHVGQSLEQLVHEQSDHIRRQAIGGFLQHFQQVVLDVLKDQVDDAFFAEGFLEFDDVGVFEQFEDFDLSHGGLFDYLIFL